MTMFYLNNKHKDPQRIDVFYFTATGLLKTETVGKKRFETLYDAGEYTVDCLTVVDAQGNHHDIKAYDRETGTIFTKTPTLTSRF